MSIFTLAIVHPKSLPYLRDISRLDDPDRWVPVATVLPNLPASTKPTSPGGVRT